MASEIDFAIALGLFFSFVAVLIIFLINYITNYTDISSTSELRTVSYNIYRSLFSGKGVPKNWTESGDSPLKIGLFTDLYRMPVIISDNSSTNRSKVTLNLSLTFDQSCDKKAWNNTVRILNATNDVLPIQLYNQTFCTQQFLKTADMVFNETFNAGDSKNFSIYYSPDKNISGANYTIVFPSLANFTFTIYPEEKLSAISVERLTAFRRLNYTELLGTISKDYYFRLEISK